MGLLILFIALADAVYVGWRFAPDHWKVMAVTKWGQIVAFSAEALAWSIPFILEFLQDPALTDIVDDYLPPKYVAFGIGVLVRFFAWARTKTIAPVGGSDPNENV